jgi:hypothetical protein
MKFSILSILAVTTIAGLTIALYVEHSRNERVESELRLRHEEELQNQKIGLAVRHVVANLLQNYRYRDTKSIRPDYDFSALAMVVNIFDNAEFLNGDNDLRREYGKTPSIAMAADLLKQLDCDSVDDCFERYRKKIEKLGQLGEGDPFKLGDKNSDRRKQLSQFIQQAVDQNRE